LFTFLFSIHGHDTIEYCDAPISERIIQFRVSKRDHCFVLQDSLKIDHLNEQLCNLIGDSELLFDIDYEEDSEKNFKSDNDLYESHQFLTENYEIRTIWTRGDFILEEAKDILGNKNSFGNSNIILDSLYIFQLLLYIIILFYCEQ